MKRITAIFFLVIFAGSFTELGQLIKLPSLVQHYYAHQQKSAVSFFDYLEEHYSSHRDDGDKNEDMQLPFKMVISTPSLVVGLPSTGPEIIDPLPISRDIKFASQQYFIASPRTFSIFHPPRTVI